MKKNSFFIVSLFTGVFAFQSLQAQIAVPFKMRYQSFLKGDMTLIANNITNRVDYNNTSNVPYYNASSHAILNDQFHMEYIDIDNDPTTFSSSSANLILNNQENKKIVYAGLYWSATYKYNSGDMKKQDKFIAIDENRSAIDIIKIKLPGNEHYTTVNGQVIFDGLNNKEFKDCAPYAAYADITNQILELKNPFGQYTVANIKATQGKISGGIASGWTLFVVYEDQSLTEKFITSFDGFAGVSDHMAEINFSGFQTQSQGTINAKFAFAALEGDNNLLGDKFLFKTATSEKFTTLSNKLRKENNFLNSSITIEDTHYLNRFPDSKNTLGYDSGIISINNPNNTVVQNNTNQALLRMQTYGDRNYVFFSAFNIEAAAENKFIINESSIVSTEKEDKNKKEDSKFAPQKKLESNIQETNIAEIVPTKKVETSLKEIKTFEDVTDVKYINIKNFPAGYYIVANVFAKKYNLENFKKELTLKGIEATSFYNPENKYSYVYLAKTSDKDEALKLYLTKVNNKYQDHVWILSVNNQPDTRLTDTE
jgi:hypothetical protein